MAKDAIGKQKGNVMGIQVDKEALQSIYADIEVLDEKIAAASGSDAAGRRSIANQVVTETQETWNPMVTKVLGIFEEVSDIKVLVGTYTALTQKLRKAHEEAVNKFLTEQVEARKSEEVTPTLTADELEVIVKERKQKNEEYKAVRNLLEMFGVDVSDVPEPKKMTGARGPRGPRVLSKYDYSVDSQPRSKTQNTLSSIANTVCSDLNWKTKDLREFLVAQGIDLQNPPAEFEVTLPNGKVLSAVRSESTDEVEEEEDFEEDFEEEEVEDLE